MKKIFILVVATIICVNAGAKEKSDSLQIKQTVGFTIDLLPPVLSASAGSFGYSAQIWYGWKKLRFRYAIANYSMPDKLMGNDDFTGLKTTASALIFDYFLNYNFKGLWIGTGVERWNGSINLKSTNNKYHVNDWVATLGTGYIFKVYKNFYIEPWGAVHYVMNNESIDVNSFSYKTKRFQGEISLKIGWHF